MEGTQHWGVLAGFRTVAAGAESWIPAFAGMTAWGGDGLRRDDGFMGWWLGGWRPGGWRLSGM